MVIITMITTERTHPWSLSHNRFMITTERTYPWSL
jgi:hypothetical protein